VSLSASPCRLARQLLTEALVPAAMGGSIGTLLAFGQLSLLKHWLPADTSRLAEVANDERALAFTAVISLVSGLLFGLLPVWGARIPRFLNTLESDRTTLSATGLQTDAALVMIEGFRGHPVDWGGPFAA
jgi:hypothetical protein